jgi:hypothetical protein
MSTVPKLLMAGAILALGLTSVNAQTGAQPGQQTPSTVDPPAMQKGQQPQTPGTTGAMDNATTGIATSAEDVRRQQQGLPTAADQAKGAQPAAQTPGLAGAPPKTVGASPGSDAPTTQKK